MITPEQATDMREFLIKELISNGFGDIVTEINIRLEEEYEESEFERSPRYILDFFLKESIDVLENISNRNFTELIDRFNEFTQGEKKIEAINVELLNAGQQVYYDLKDLPNYDKITVTFREILQEIRKEN